MKTRLILLCLVVCGALAILTTLAVEDIITGQVFGIAGFALMIISAGIFYFLLRRNIVQNDHQRVVPNLDFRSRFRKRKSIRITILVLWFIVGYWITRGDPWAPRLVGASVLLLVLIGTIMWRPKE